jgi:N12 class adenine-specific DNA methylase
MSKKPSPSPVQLLEGLDRLVSALDGSDIRDPERTQIRAILMAYRIPAADALIFVERMKIAITKLDHLTEAARTLLLQDVSDYPNEEDKDERRQIKARLYKALTGRPPEESAESKRREAREILAVAGHEARRPNWDRERTKMLAMPKG